MRISTPSRAASALTLGMVVLVATTIFAQQLSGPTSTEETTAKLVVDMIERYHISHDKIDDEISAKTLKRYLEELDPQKLYFLKSDVERLSKYKFELDDLLKAGNVDFAFSTHDLYLKRLKERMKLAHELIDAEHDFSVKESMVVDPDELGWADSQDEIRERWRKRIKNDLLSLKLDGKALDEAREQIHKRYENIERFAKQTGKSEKLEMYLSAVTHSFDPHSSYMSPETLEDFRISMELSLEGIGAALRSEDGYVTVAEIVPGGAADKDGRLKVNDKIIGVAQGENGEFVDVVEMKLSRVVQLIRGKKGSQVRLKVRKAATNEVETYVLTRQKIELKSSAVKGEIIQTQKRLGDGKARIGVIHIPSFYRDFRGEKAGRENFKSTARDVLKVLRNFRDSGGVDAVVVDLRTNGGGALSEAVEVSGLFIDQGPVVQVKEEGGEVETHDDTREGVAYAGPLVVICNRLSASASEIFAGAIKDYQRGVVVGDTRTHGKGTVQNVMPVSQRLFRFLDQEERGALKLTINKFYRVNGASTQSRGVRSDVILPSRMDHMDLGEKFLDNALGFDRIEAAEYTPYDLVTPDTLSALRKASRKRVAQSEEFQEVQEQIEEDLEEKESNTISLQEQVRRENREDDGADSEESEEKDDESELEEAPGDSLRTGGDRDDSAFPDNYYNNEVLQITLDYIDMFRSMETARK